MEKDIKKINLDAEESHPKPRKRKSLFKRYKLILFVASLLIGFTFLWSLIHTTSSVITNGIPNLFDQNPIKQTDGRVNILLLGNGGGKHDGPDLTDSIIIASYHIKTHQVMLISIPRDVWVDSTKTKINALYVLGNKKQNGGNGLNFAKNKIDDLLGFPIHYGVRIDFGGFERAIDLVEGVDVEVEKTFDDYLYPITGKENDLCGLIEKEVELSEEQIKALNMPVDQGQLKPGKNKVLVDMSDKIATESANFACRFEHIHFDKGITHMDGETALKYVRSRHGLNGEGSDFARSKRQQLVIQAFREKVLSLNTLANPGKVLGLIDTFGDSFETDLPKDKFLDLYSMFKKLEKTENLVLGSLGNGKSVLVVPPPGEYGGAFVLVPPNGDFKIVQDFLKSELEKQATTSATQR